MMATVAAARIALALPENFDTAVTMTFQQKGDVRWHPTRDAASFADKLLSNGAPEDIALAEKVLNAFMACQETRPGDPHFGNFW
ncbi:MAG: hypothetical protein O3B73_00075 [bacterium]|nr:hypothetical protein [bacterium]